MPSVLHEAILELFRSRTTLAPELLRDVLGVPVPDYERAVSVESTFTELVPTEYTADLVILLEDDEPVLGIVVEVQLARDPDKLYSWPFYAASLRARHRCPATVLVVTPSAAVAEWAAAVIDLGGPNRYRPWVLGPSLVPLITDEEEALSAPELGVLSALAHGRDQEGAAVAFAAMVGLQRVDDNTRSVYYDLIMASLSEAARKGLEAMVQSRKHEYISDFAKENFARGLQEGRQEGQALALLTLIGHRGWAPTPEQVVLIQSATEEELTAWLLRVVDADRLEQLFL
ncbi:MAG: hypothetical protein IPG45_26445 [Deltaproteobacteria bacterium]|nr:hypothetical protein [Deltaproteobacteria bacterium]